MKELEYSMVRGKRYEVGVTGNTRVYIAHRRSEPLKRVRQEKRTLRESD